MFKAHKITVVITVVLLFSVLTIHAEDVVLNVDGNWHDLNQVSVYTSTNANDVLVNSTWHTTWDNPQTLPYSQTSTTSQKSCYIGIPLRGEDWQVNANQKLEIRFNLSLYSTIASNINYKKYGNVVLPTNEATAKYPVWWGCPTVFYVNPTSTKMTKYKLTDTQIIDVYKTAYGGTESTTADGITYFEYGYLYDIVIPAGWLSSDTRTLYIPINLDGVDNQIVYVAYAKVRSIEYLSDYELLTSILTAIQGINGITPEQMQQAVYNAIKQFSQEEQTQLEQEANNNEAAIDSAVGTIKEKFNIDTIKNAYQPYINLITSTETEDFVLHVPETTINLSGQAIKIIPEITYNVTAEVKKLDNAAANVSSGSTAGWTTLKTLIGAIISISVCTGTVLTIKTLITSVTSGFVKDGTKNE